jgi:hypothetical protein
MSKCDEAVARYREKLGEHWKGADEILFRAAWNEGAAAMADKDAPIINALAAIPEQDLKAWLVEPPITAPEAYQELARAELARREEQG